MDRPREDVSVSCHHGHAAGFAPPVVVSVSTLISTLIITHFLVPVILHTHIFNLDILMTSGLSALTDTLSDVQSLDRQDL